MMQHIVLLTATIRPKPGQQLLKVVDVESRLDDYKQALAFYSKLLDRSVIHKVVFVENSNYDLSNLQHCFNHPNIEWLGFYGLDYPEHYHRGYGEFKLIDYAFEHATALKTITEQDIVWKITGRYIIENLSNMIRFSPPQLDFYCNKRRNWVDMEIMAWSKEGYQKLIKHICKTFASGKAPELILAERMLMPTDGLRVVDSFFWLPLIVGRRGTDGGQFVKKNKRYKFFIKQAAKLIMLPIRFIRLR